MRSRGCQMQIAALLVAIVAAACAARSGQAAASPQTSASAKPLDYEFFKTRVMPIFLKRRPGHARCYACHGSGTGPQYLLPLPAGKTFWTEEQSRQIFRNVSSLVDRDDPAKSLFIIHPLSPMAGGDITAVHSGGRQFGSKDDPDWKIMAAWVNGAKATSSAKAQ